MRISPLRHRARLSLKCALALLSVLSPVACTTSELTAPEPAPPMSVVHASGCGPSASGLRLWLRASDLALLDGASVESWGDSSGQGTHATQSVISARPTLRWNAISGRAAVDFDGVNDRLDLATNVFASDNFPLTVFAVLKTTDASAHVVGTGSSSAGFLTTYGSGLTVVAGKPTVKANSNGSGLHLSGLSSISDGQPRVISSITRAGASSLFVNGQLTAESSAALTAYPYGKSTLGASDGSSSGASQDAFSGQLAELLVYTRALSPSEQTQIEQCLGSEYGVTIVLPPGCDGVPGSGATVDACGVCGGDGASCADEAVILSGRALWLRADDLLAADGSPVGSWVDTSNESSYAAQGTAASRPVLRRNAISGHAAVDFDGFNDRLDLATNVFASGNFPLTVFAVLKTADTSAHVVGTGSSSAGFLTTYGSGLTVVAGKPTVKANSNGSGLHLSGPSSISDGQPRVISSMTQASTSSLFVNGQLAAQSSAALDAYPYGKSTVGASDGSSSSASQDALAGQLAELIVYTRALNPSEQMQITQYLGDKYGVSITLPPGCDGVPGSGATIDACGVCGGNGTSCADEAVISSGRALWLRADDLLSAATDGSSVASWDDASGQGSDASQGSPSACPVLRQNAISGHAAVEFDGVNDRLDLAGNVFASGNFPLTVFTVLKTADTSAHVVGTGSSSAGFLTTYGSGLTVVAGKPTVKANSNGSGLHLSSASTANNGSAHLVTAVAKSGANRLYVDCVSSGSSPASTTPYGYGKSTLGASDGSEAGQSMDPLAGHIAEVIVYHRALSEFERVAIEDYLASKYGLTGCVHAPVDPAVSLAESAAMFWRMDETGTVDRADLVSGMGVMPFPPDAAGISQVPAVHGMGQQVNGPTGYHFWRPSHPVMSHGGDSFTWAGWMKLDSFYDSQTFAGKWANTPGGREYRIWYNASAQRFEFQVSSTGGADPGEVGTVTHPANVSLGIFYFLEAWHDADAETINLRVGTTGTRGTVASSPWAGGVHVSSSDLNIGAHNTCQDAHVHGVLDAIGYWKRVLAEPESQRLWNGGAGFEP